MLTVILTGGQSRRMGRDKAGLPLEPGGPGMRDALVLRYAKSLGDVAVSVDRAGRYDGDMALELPDSFPGSGPMNGIYSAFSQTDAESIFLTATDLVNGDPTLALYLAERLGGHEACVIRRSTGHLEPLFAIYARSCFKIAEAYLSEKRRSMLQLIKAADTVFVDESELSSRWNLDEVLWNINTPEDYEALLSKRTARE